MKPLALDAFLQYKFIHQINFNPKGNAAAFVLSESDEMENDYRHFIYLYQQGRIRKLTGMGNESSFVWEDDSHLLFAAARSKQETARKEAGELFTSFYRLDIHGGEASFAFELPLIATSLKKAKEHVWLVSGIVDVSNPDAYRLEGKDKADYYERLKQGKDYEELTQIPFYANGGGFVNQKRTGLFVYDTDTNELERIFDASYEINNPLVHGEDVYFLALPKNEVMSMKKVQIYRYNLISKQITQLTHDDMVYSGLAFLGDKLLAAGAAFDEYELNPDEDFYEVDIEKGECVLFATNQDTLGNMTSSDCRFGHGRTYKEADGMLYLVKTVRNSSYLYRLNADGCFECLVEKEGSVDDFDVNDQGEILLCGMYDNQLEELYTYEQELKQVSYFNEAVLKDTYVASPQKLTIDSQGWDIDGWVLYPIDYDETKSYPAILDIHGGPRAVYGEVFFHEMQVWASRGYFVFFCNPAGSAGRGLEFADITGRYGEIDYLNIMDFTDAVLHRYPQIDAKRLGCTGGSYGGFMCNWILGHTDRFAAIATQRSISNWVSFYGMSDIGYFFTKMQIGMDLYSEEGIKKLWDHSPLKYIEDMHTPTLIIHSNQDYRCPLEQGLQLFTALKEKGIESKLVLFKGENHELSRSGKPKHRLKRLMEITDWLDRHTRLNELC